MITNNMSDFMHQCKPNSGLCRNFVFVGDAVVSAVKYRHGVIAAESLDYIVYAEIQIICFLFICLNAPFVLCGNWKRVERKCLNVISVQKLISFEIDKIISWPAYPLFL